jgi:calcineurin-like phosphoesterase family protein
MKVGILSDNHFRLGGKKIHGFWDRRLMDGLVVSEQAVDRLKDCDIVIHCGDLFDRRYTTDFKVLAGISEVIGKLEMPVYFLVGNHDTYHDTVNSLNILSLRKGWHIVNEVQRVDAGGLSLVLCPYYDDVAGLGENAEFARGGDMLFLHQFLAGHRYQSDLMPVFGPEVFNWEGVLGSKFGWVMSGHNHRSEISGDGKVIALGSVMQLCFDDNGASRGCWTFDGNRTLFHELAGPRYHTITDPSQVENDRDYYRLMVPETKFVGEVPENVVVRVVSSDVGVDRLNLGDRWNWDDVLKKYVEKTVDSDSQGDYLAAGLAIMREVGVAGN